MQNRHRIDEAIDHFQQSLTIDPKPGAHLNLGLALVEAGRLAEAEAHEREAVRLDPQDGESHMYLGRLLQQTGRPAEALAEFQTALKLAPDRIDAAADLALAYQNAGQTAQSRDLAQKVLDAMHDPTQAARLSPQVVDRLKQVVAAGATTRP